MGRKFHYEYKAVRNDGVVLAQNKSRLMCRFDATCRNNYNQYTFVIRKIRVYG